MQTRISIRTVVFALATMSTLTIGASVAFARERDDLQQAGSPAEEQNATINDARRDNTLVGVWASFAAGAVDCLTREPLPDSPKIRAVYTFHQGGTLSEENTDSIEGPYRTSGFGIWRRTSGRSYIAVYGHFGYNPLAFDENSRKLAAIIRARTSITLSRNGKTLKEDGAYEVFFPDPDSGEPGEAVVTGCFAATATRLTFE